MHPVLNKGERSGKKRPQAMQIDMEIFPPKNDQHITKTIDLKSNKCTMQNKQQIIDALKEVSGRLNANKILSNVVDAIDHKQHSDQGLGLLLG
jgi:hypothetical protein